MSYKTFSIAIPAYKAKFLSECIDSILLQTYPFYELIIVDDDSPEFLERIIEKYDDSRIKYYRNKKNCGALNVVDNWNICLSYATGEFLILMGDDDKLEPDFLKEFSFLIDKYPDLDIFHCRSCVINDKSEPQWITPSWPEYETIYENIWHRMKEYRHQFISDFVYRTSSLKSNGGFYKLPLAWASDDISAFIAMDNRGIAHTQKPLFLYRESPITITSSSNECYKLDAINLEYVWYTKFLETHLPLSATDKIYFRNIAIYKEKYFQKKRIFTLSQSFAKNGLKVFFYLKYRKKYNLSISEIIYAVVMAIKQYHVSKKISVK